MANLTKAEPPAWAVNLSLSLEDMANQNQIMQQILELAHTNCQLQGVAAQAQAEQQANIAENQADQTRQDADLAITEGSFGLGSSVFSVAFELWGYRKSINEAKTQLGRLNEYDQAIKETPGSSPMVNFREADADGKAILSVEEKQQMTDAKQILNKKIEDQKITDTDKQHISLLKGSDDQKSFDDFKTTVRNKIKKVEKELQTYESKKQQREQLVQGFTQGVSKTMAGGLFNANKANDQEASAAFQYVNALAQYLAQASNAANQTIMGQKDQIFNLMMSTAQELIGGMAQANQIR